ncbi:unnamed protein product, partial [Mesorhabditis belari]|uniref:Uncharacterized protein n=1 Tax=Mesorhabditis belari TaxID=2138241 RepID=A0AAF3EHH4_9BILA
MWFSLPSATKGRRNPVKGGKGTKDPKITFPANPTESFTILLGNQGKKEMLCLVYPPLPKESAEKPFAGDVWGTVNRWRLVEKNVAGGWSFATSFQTYDHDEYRTILLNSGETKKIELWCDDEVQQGVYALKVYAWNEKMGQAEHGQINVAKGAKNVGRGMYQKTSAEVFAQGFGELLKKKLAGGMALKDVSREIDSRAVTIPVDRRMSGDGSMTNSSSRPKESLSNRRRRRPFQPRHPPQLSHQHHPLQHRHKPNRLRRRNLSLIPL